MSVPLNDQKLLDHLEETIIVPITDRKKQGIATNVFVTGDGLFNTIVNQPRTNFIAAGGNVLITDAMKNSAIVIGRDRPSTKASGYGGRGAMFANTIDLVAGRVSANSRKLPDGSQVNNSFSSDAARVYISQMTDVDLNFGIEPGFGGQSVARSAVAVKADAVRIIGREGVKIVSGRSFAFKGHGSSGETNSLGGKISQPAPPIELIAGNTKTEAGMMGIGPEIRVLQGVAKGENLRDGLRELADIVESLWAACYAMGLWNTFLFSNLGVTLPFLPHHTTACSIVSFKYLTDVLNPLWHTRANKNVWKVNYTNPGGDKYIVSTNVYST